MRPVARPPEHGHPHHGDQSELRQDDGDLSEIVQLIENYLHRAHLPLKLATTDSSASHVCLGVALASVLQPFPTEVRR